jgi:hypothetical protein
LAALEELGEPFFVHLVVVSDVWQQIEEQTIGVDDRKRGVMEEERKKKSHLCKTRWVGKICGFAPKLLPKWVAPLQWSLPRFVR